MVRCRFMICFGWMVMFSCCWFGVWCGVMLVWGGGVVVWVCCWWLVCCCCVIGLCMLILVISVMSFCVVVV